MSYHTYAPKQRLPLPELLWLIKSFASGKRLKIDNDENTSDEKCQLESNGSCCRSSFAAGAVSCPPPAPPPPPGPRSPARALRQNIIKEYHKSRYDKQTQHANHGVFSSYILQAEVWQCVSTPIKVVPVPAEQQGEQDNIPQTPGEDPDDDDNKSPSSRQDRFIITPADTNPVYRSR